MNDNPRLSFITEVDNLRDVGDCKRVGVGPRMRQAC